MHKLINRLQFVCGRFALLSDFDRGGRFIVWISDGQLDLRDGRGVAEDNFRRVRDGTGIAAWAAGFTPPPFLLHREIVGQLIVP